MAGGCCQDMAICCRIVLFLLVIAGIVFSAITNSSCSFMESSWFFESNRHGVGLYLIEVYDTDDGKPPDDNDSNDGDVERKCRDYPDNYSFSSSENSARICGVLAPIIALFVLLIGLLEFCCRICCSKCIYGSCLTASWVCQALTFLLYNSDTFCTGKFLGACKFSAGSGWSIAAWVMYFAASIAVCCSPMPEPIFCQKGDDDEEREPQRKPEPQVSEKPVKPTDEEEPDIPVKPADEPDIPVVVE